MIEVGKLNQYKPLKYTNNSYIVSWGLSNHGADLYSWNYEKLQYKPSINDIKRIINNYYNNIIKNNIENNFIWNNMNIKLTLENQIDYKLLFDTTMLLDGTNLPEKVKFKNGNENIYYSFEDIDDMKNFIIAMNEHIRMNLNIGYDLKESVNYNDYIKILETL